MINFSQSECGRNVLLTGDGYEVEAVMISQTQCILGRLRISGFFFFPATLCWTTIMRAESKLLLHNIASDWSKLSACVRTHTYNE